MNANDKEIREIKGICKDELEEQSRYCTSLKVAIKNKGDKINELRKANEKLCTELEVYKRGGTTEGTEAEY